MEKCLKGTLGPCFSLMHVCTLFVSLFSFTKFHSFFSYICKGLALVLKTLFEARVSKTWMPLIQLQYLHSNAPITFVFVGSSLQEKHFWHTCPIFPLRASLTLGTSY